MFLILAVVNPIYWGIWYLGNRWTRVSRAPRGAGWACAVIGVLLPFPIAAIIVELR
ncbi:hypothetical protein [Luteococcus peritonei]|uniref:Cardiolipin synthase N-terminal domain-containing protein n=1 Tax=Luteococcus peritonei TaxID=88874 RepID=A0ABW4RVF0_9ACTN